MKFSIQQSDLYRPVINPQKICNTLEERDHLESIPKNHLTSWSTQEKKISFPSIFPFQPPVDCLQKKINHCNIDAEILLFNNFGSLLIGGIIKKYQFFKYYFLIKKRFRFFCIFLLIECLNNARWKVCRSLGSMSEEIILLLVLPMSFTKIH